VATGQEEVDIHEADAREDNKEDRIPVPDSRHRISTSRWPEQTILLSLTSCLTMFLRSFRWTRRESMPLDFPKEGS
jgi:hypothetical protein